MSISTPTKRSPLSFFILLFVLTLPFWLLSALVQTPSWVPINLPLSALAIVSPPISACILLFREEGASGVGKLLRRSFDLRRIKPLLWYLPILLLCPLILLLSYWVALLLGQKLPEPHISPLTLLVFLLVFLFAALCEELGWTGYATDPLQERWGALTGALLLGTVWALWHIIGFKQGHDWVWVAGQCFTTIGLRVLMVWLYNNAGRSLFAMVLFHAMVNVSEFSYPNNGSHYDPVITGTITAIIAVIVTYLWGARTLAHFRFVRQGSVL